MDEFERIYLKKLESFPFECEEEALALGLKNFSISYEDKVIPIETPFTIKPKVIKSTSDTYEEEEDKNYVISDSSTSESSNDELYHGDIQLDISLSIKGKLIVDNSELTIERSKKYGLVGRNGIGKTTLLNALRKRKFGMPKGLKIYMIKQEDNSDISVIDHVGNDGGRILQGFGFSKEMFSMSLNSLSGGWRMRAHLAKAININPDLLLLDEPTNYLDINALAWLETQIKQMKTVIIVSHDKNFMNSCVDEIFHLNDLKIDVYKGNYDAFVIQRTNRLILQQKEYENLLEQREHLQSFIDRFRYNSKRASLAQSKIKALSKMPPLSPPKKEPIVKFVFNSSPSQDTLVEFRDVSFSYKNIVTDGEQKIVKENRIFENLTIAIKKSSRIIIVGANGQGKSTFLKILNNDLKNCDGYVSKSSSLIVGYFAQHHIDNLNVNEKVLDVLMEDNTLEDSKRALSSFGLNVENQRIGTLSGGQKSRLTMALINLKKPNLLVFDEPTNHLDMESIEALALALAIKNFNGAVVCVSHDLNFVTKAFDEVFVCENKTLKYFNGTVIEYKEMLKSNL